LNYSPGVVSIIIPVYNAQDYLEECLDSALNQTYDKIEIITVNDGSKDNSLDILKKYSNKIKIISKKNGGTASALNLGIKNMSGEWFKWLSADDVLYPNAVKELIDEAKLLPDKRYILYSNYDIIDSHGKIVDKKTEPNYNELDSFSMNVILLDHFVGNGTTSLIHQSIIDEFGMFSETIGYKEDYELWLRYNILYDCGLHLVSKNLAKYRVHKKQLTKENVTISLSQSNTIRKYILDKLAPEERKKYEKALDEYQKTKPLASRGRHILRNMMLKVLPKSFSGVILKSYMSTKEK